jgi:hypothetical protein
MVVPLQIVRVVARSVVSVLAVFSVVLVFIMFMSSCLVDGGG